MKKKTNILVILFRETVKLSNHHIHHSISMHQQPSMVDKKKFKKERKVWQKKREKKKERNKEADN